MDEFVDDYPDSCHGCGHEFGEDEKLPSRRPGRRQVAELPPITVIVTEHRSHRLRCPCCNRRTAAGFPAAVADSAFGPRLQAAIVTLTAPNRISRRDLSELARDLFGIRLSVGAVEAICRRGSIALAEPHEALVASVLGSPAVNVDEAGSATAGNDRTLWTATTPGAAIFRIAADRHRDRLQELLGERFAGICCSDPGGPTTRSTPKAARPVGATSSETSASTPKDSPSRSSSVSRASNSPAASSTPGTPTSNTKTAPGSNARSTRSKPSSANCSKKPGRRPRATSTTAASPTTS